MFDPQSPSVRRGGMYGHEASIEQYAELGDLLSHFVVCRAMYKHTTFALRRCSRSMRQSVDAAIDQWCAHLSHLRDAWVACSDGEETVRLLVEMECVVGDAFGPLLGPLRNLMLVSRLDRHCFQCALVGKCTICGHRMQKTSFDIIDYEAMIPSYTYAHTTCQRKHMVVIGKGSCGPRLCSSEPRALASELNALFAAEAVKWTSSDEVQATMSPWFRRVSHGRLIVWLRPHKLVRTEDTLYGAFSVSPAMVAKAVKAQDAIQAEMAAQLERRRSEAAKRAYELSVSNEAELRLWLGRGDTRWRTVEALEAEPWDLMKSTGMCRLVNPFGKCLKLGHSVLNYHCNILCAVDLLLNSAIDRAHLDVIHWCLESITATRMFSKTRQELSSSIPGVLDFMVRDAIASNSSATGMLSALGPGSAEVLVSSATFHHFVGVQYSATVTIDGFIGSRIFITHTDMCKLKFVLARYLPASLVSMLPSLPSKLGDDGMVKHSAACYLEQLLSIAFSPGSGRARARMLSVVISPSTYKELASSMWDRDSAAYIRQARRVLEMWRFGGTHGR